MSTIARRRAALVSVVLIWATTAHALATGDRDFAGMVRVGGHPQKDVVLWLEGVTPLPSAPRKVVMDQRNLTFSPHVLAVEVGTSVSMPNNDRVFHNVFSFRDGKRFDLGLYPVGRSKLVTFDKPGVSRIFCNIHPNMAAYVVAVNSAFFAVSEADGVFTMASVPPGVYTYHAWRAGHDPATGQIIVEPGRRAEVELR